MTFTLKRTIGTICATAIAATGFIHAPQPASADNDFLKGLAVGIGGALIVNEANKNKKQQTKKVVRKAAPSGPRPTIATFPTTRDQVRDYQARLNTLGYNAGAPDGLYGGKTRTAVSQFQMSIGAAATGVLSEADANILYQQSNQFAAGLASTGTANGFVAAPQTGAFPAPQAAAGVTGFPAPAVPGTGQVGAAPAPAFPAIGGGTGQMAAAPAPGFPAPGTPGVGQVASAPGATFPAIGATGQPAPAATATFPTIGAETQQAPQANAPAFPQLGTTAPAGTLASAPGAAAPTSTFPAIGAPDNNTVVAQVAPTFPSVTGAAEPTQADNGATIALAAVPQVALPAETVPRFSILGITTGEPLDAALVTLAKEGYSSCKTIDAITHCLTAAGANQDIVSIHAMAMPDGSKQVAAMSRRINFGQPMQTTQLSAMMADRYAGLLSAQANMVGTADCGSVGDLATSNATALSDKLMSESNAGLAELVDNCAHFSRIVFGENTGESAVDKLSIFLFDGTVFAASPDRPMAQAPIKF